MCAPRTQLTSISEGQPNKTRPFPIKTYQNKGHVGSRYMYVKIIVVACRAQNHLPHQNITQQHPSQLTLQLEPGVIILPAQRVQSLHSAKWLN